MTKKQTEMLHECKMFLSTYVPYIKVELPKDKRISGLEFTCNGIKETFLKAGFPESKQVCIKRCCEAIYHFGNVNGRENGYRQGQNAFKKDFAKFMGIKTESEIEDMIDNTVDRIRISR